MPSQRKRSNRQSLKAAVDCYLTDLSTAGRVKGTVANRAYALSCFARHVKINDIRKINRQKVLCYRKYVFKTKSSCNHKNFLLFAVKDFFRWAGMKRIIFLDPAANLVLPKQKARRIPETVSCQRLAELMEGVADLRSRAIAETLYSTGMRRAEAAKLKLCDINFADGLVSVRAGKGAKDRIVPIGAVALCWMDRYIKEVRGAHPGSLFGVSAWWIWKMLSCLGKRAGIRLHPHLLRHSFATHLLEGGAGIRYIADLLGHSRLSTTQIYTRVFPSQLQKAFRLSHPTEKRTEKLPSPIAPVRMHAGRSSF